MIHSCHLVNTSEGLLFQHAVFQDFVETWKIQSRIRMIVCVLIWICAVLSRFVLEGIVDIQGMGSEFRDDGLSHQGLSWDIIVFAFSAGVLSATSFCVQHFANALILVVDAYACRQMEAGDDRSAQPMSTVMSCNFGLKEWNFVLAVLKLSSEAFWRSFLMPLVSSALSLLLCAVGAWLNNVTDSNNDQIGGTLSTLVPVVILTITPLLTLMRVAEVSGQCLRLPRFLNSLARSDEIEENLTLVRYIKDGEAGFYVSDSLLTASTACKAMYMCGTIMFVIFTKAMAV
jgi:hypothetical protein